MSGTARRGRGAAAALVGLSGPLALALPAPAAESAPTVASLSGVVVAAHRGGGMEVRENSLSGLQATFDTGLVHVLDVDARVRQDGTVVVMHDPTVDRVSRAQGKVTGFTAASWGQVVLDIGSWLPQRPAPEPAPTLASVLDRFGGHIVLTVEAKHPAAVDGIAPLVKARGLTESVLVSSHQPAVARRIHALGLHSQLWRNARQMRRDDPRTFARYVDVLEADITATDTDIRKFVSSGVQQVWVHTVTTRAERARALRLGADGLMTDTPRYLTGATNAYPAPPTVLKVFRAPEPTQLSDAGWMQVRVSAESGPGLPDTPVRVSGDGVAGRVVGRTPQAVVTIKLATRQSHVGSRSVRVAVSPGSAHERRWGAGSRSVPVTLTPEDLQLRPGVATRGRQVRFGLRLLDSAAAGYTGRRRETGPRRTVLGLGRAQLRLTVRHGGRVVHRTTARGTDAGRAGAGDGRVVLAWQAPARGRYVVRVSERGPSYQATGVSRRFRVR